MLEAHGLGCREMPSAQSQAWTERRAAPPVWPILPLAWAPHPLHLPSSASSRPWSLGTRTHVRLSGGGQDPTSRPGDPWQVSVSSFLPPLPAELEFSPVNIPPVKWVQPLHEAHGLAGRHSDNALGRIVLCFSEGESSAAFGLRGWVDPPSRPEGCLRTLGLDSAPRLCCSHLG